MITSLATTQNWKIEKTLAPSLITCLCGQFFGGQFHCVKYDNFGICEIVGCKLPFFFAVLYVAKKIY
jgi:hypothetical protein